MDGESASPGLNKSSLAIGKKPRKQKGRPPKPKQDSDATSDTVECQTYTFDQVIGMSLSNSSSAQRLPGRPKANVNSGDDVAPVVNRNLNASHNSGPLNNKHKSENVKKGQDDNRLMPPPPPTLQNTDLTNTQKVESMEIDDPTRKENLGNQGNKGKEVIFDGFSIIGFDSLQEVQAALQASGRAFENKRLNMVEKTCVAASKSPRLPTRDTRSPTGRRKTKTPTERKSKEPRTKHGRKSTAKSPLACTGGLPSVAQTDTISQSKSDLPSTSMVGVKSETEVKEEKGLSFSLSSTTTEGCKLEQDLPSESSTVKQPPDEILVKVEQRSSVKEEAKFTLLPSTKSSPPSAAIPIATPTATVILPGAEAAANLHTEQKLCSAEPKFIPRFENISPDITKESPTDSSSLVHELNTRSCTATQGCDAVTSAWSGSAGVSNHSLAATATEPISLTTTTIPVVSRSNSVHSVTSTNSRHNTPVCTPSAGSSTSKDRENGGGSSRATSRCSERNTSRGSHQPPSTSSADPFSAGLFGSPPYPNMLSFGGPNGLPAPYNYPGASALGQSHSGFPFGSPDMLPSFNHSTPLSNASQDQIRAELSRRMLMQAGDRAAMPPFLRPEQLFPPHNSGINSTSLPPAPPNAAIPPTGVAPALFFQQMLDKMPPIQQMLYSQQRNAATSTASTAGPSPFQSVPGGHHNPSTSSDTTQKKSGKWCAAHVHIAYKIYNATRQRADAHRNGLVSGNTGDADKKPVNLPHSINSLTSTTVHRPKDVLPATAVRSKPSAAQSPVRRSPSREKTTPSPLHRLDKHKQRSVPSNPSSPASFSSSSSTKELGLVNRNVANGLLPPTSKSSLESASTSVTMPSTSHSTPNSAAHSTSPLIKKREREDFRKSNGSAPFSSANSSKRPSSSSHPANKRRRSRSRSPKPAHMKSLAQSPWSNSSNGHPMVEETNKSVALPPPVSAGSVLDFQQQQQSQLLNMFAAGLMGDNKALPTNGYPANAAAAAAAAASLWNPYLQQQQQQRDFERERMFNPSIALALAQRDRQERSATATAMQYLDMDRANSLHSSSLTGLNGYHNSSALSSLGAISNIGGPPPLIPTSQAKLPTAHPLNPSSAAGASSTDRDRLYPR